MLYFYEINCVLCEERQLHGQADTCIHTHTYTHGPLIINIERMTSMTSLSAQQQQQLTIAITMTKTCNCIAHTHMRTYIHMYACVLIKLYYKQAAYEFSAAAATNNCVFKTRECYAYFRFKS